MMEIFKALAIGVLQGFTEFLPVSSSGHLVLVQELFGFNDSPGVFFESVLHLATVFAVIVFFQKSIRENWRQYLPFILLGSIPAGLIGIVFKEQIEILFSSTMVVFAMLIVTGTLNWFTDKFKTSKENLNLRKSLLIGVAQALAIVPGISRSGSTIFTGSALGLEKKKAAEFSFLLSIPAIVGANLVEAVTYQGRLGEINWLAYLFGFMAAFISGMGGIFLVRRLLLAGRFRIFALYCIGVGVAGLLLL